MTETQIFFLPDYACFISSIVSVVACISLLVLISSAARKRTDMEGNEKRRRIANSIGLTFLAYGLFRYGMSGYDFHLLHFEIGADAAVFSRGMMTMHASLFLPSLVASIAFASGLAIEALKQSHPTPDRDE